MVIGVVHTRFLRTMVVVVDKLWRWMRFFPYVLTKVEEVSIRVLMLLML